MVLGKQAQYHNLAFLLGSIQMLRRLPIQLFDDLIVYLKLPIQIGIELLTHG